METRSREDQLDQIAFNLLQRKLNSYDASAASKTKNNALTVCTQCRGKTGTCTFIAEHMCHSGGIPPDNVHNLHLTFKPVLQQLHNPVYELEDYHLQLRAAEKYAKQEL